MNSTLRITVFLLIAFIIIPFPILANNYENLIVGVWELERYDNIQPADTPPAGLTNINYIFYKNGQLKYFNPGEQDNIKYGRGNTPYEEYIPYKIKGNSFWGWLGLVNDLDGERKIQFMNKDQFTIEYTDKSIATFKRLSTNTSKYPKQKLEMRPFTISGHTYNESFVEKVRKEANAPTTGSPFTKTIIGKWEHINKEEGIKVTIEFKPDKTFKQIVESINYSSVSPQIINSNYTLNGIFLIPSNHRIPTEIQITKKEMKLTTDGVQFITFQKI